MAKKKKMGIELIALGIILFYLIVNSQTTFLGGIWQSRSYSSLLQTCNGLEEHGKIYKRTVYYGPCVKVHTWEQYYYSGGYDYTSQPSTPGPGDKFDILGPTETDLVKVTPFNKIDEDLFEEVDEETLKMDEADLANLHNELSSRYPSDPSTMVFAIQPQYDVHAHSTLYYKRCGSRTYYCLVTPPHTVGNCYGSGWHFRTDCGMYCGNGVCDGSEDYSTCPQDCECDVMTCEDMGEGYCGYFYDDVCDAVVHCGCEGGEFCSSHDECFPMMPEPDVEYTCEDYRFSTCPEECETQCISSLCYETDEPDPRYPDTFLIECTDDCDGVGSCYTPSIDTDGDGVFDEDDNCYNVSNPNQWDYDNDTIGDPCDNCPQTNNTDQTDSDYDGFGDACDPETDHEEGTDCSTGETSPCSVGGCEGRQECVDGKWTSCHSQFTYCVDGTCRMNCGEAVRRVECRAWQSFNEETGQCEINAILAFLLVPVRNWVKRKFRVRWL